MKGLRILTGALAMTLLCVAMAFASEAAGGHHELPWDNFAYRLITFVVVIGVLWFKGGKKAVSFFTGRRSGIEQELADLETRKTEARKSLADVEQRIANIETERQAIIADYRAQGERVKEAIIAKAEASAAQITAQAAKTAETEVKQAIEQMRAEMAELVVSSAEKMLEEQLTAEDHEKLVDKYLTKVVLN